MTSLSIVGPLITCGGGGGDGDGDGDEYRSLSRSTIRVLICSRSGGENDLGRLGRNLGGSGEGDRARTAEGLLTLSTSTILVRSRSISGGGPPRGLGLLPLRIILGGGLGLLRRLSIRVGGGGLELARLLVSCRSIVSTSLFLSTMGPGSGLRPSSRRKAGGPRSTSRSRTRTSTSSYSRSRSRSRARGGPRERGGLRPSGLRGRR